MTNQELHDCLAAAQLSVDDALRIVSETWEAESRARTPRLADAVSMLERARQDLQAECRRLEKEGGQ